MTREEFTNFINDLEKKYPVNEWKIEGIHLWPLIKIRLSFSFHSKPSPKFSEQRSYFFILKSLFKSVYQLADLYLKNEKKPKRLFCLAPHFRFFDGEKYINRYFNKLINSSEDSSLDFIFGEYGNTTKEYREKVDFSDKTLYLENYKYLALIIRKFLWKRYYNNAEWTEFQEFINDVENKLGKKFISKEELIKQFTFIDLLKKIYKIFLVKNSVNEVYLLCYYVSEMYAMNLATSELQINSWDIQHGGQGNLHLAYSNFNKIPTAGYKLLPKRFWVWDSASGAVISKWSSKQNYHQVEVKGNPWIDFCLKTYSSGIPDNKKIILYTMQPVGGTLLENYIIEAIKKTPPEFEWWLRLHPRQLQEKAKLQSIINAEGISSRVNINEALYLPLPGILSKTFVHISKFSGSILEAFIMKVKTIIISQIGVESFPDVVNSEYAVIHLDQNADKLIDQILNVEIIH